METRKESVEKLVELYADSLYTWAYYMTSDQVISEDLVQETYLAAFQNFDTFREKSSTKTWLFSILRNKIADHFRKSFRESSGSPKSFDHYFDEHGDWLPEQRPLNIDPGEENILADEEIRNALKECMEKLPRQWKHLIVLKFLEEKKSREICQELSVSATNFWQIIHRAKLQLRKCLETNLFMK